VIVEPGVADEVKEDLPFAFTPPVDGTFHEEDECVNVDIHGELHRTVDAIITLGGDGTILHAASLFSSTYVPPILSFSLGTLGFLLPFSKAPFHLPTLMIRFQRLQDCIFRHVHIKFESIKQDATNMSIYRLNSISCKYIHLKQPQWLIESRGLYKSR